MSRDEQDDVAEIPAPQISLKQQQQRPSPRKRLFFVLKFLVSSALIVWIISTANLSDVRDAMVGVDLRWLALAMAMQVVGAVIITLRWQRLLAINGASPGLGYLFNSVMVSTFFRQFLPSIIGGDAIRSYDAWRAGTGSALAVMSLVVDRLSGLLALAVFALIAFLFLDSLSESLPALGLWIFLGFAGLLAVIICLFLPSRFVLAPFRPLRGLLPQKVADKIVKIVQAVRIYEDHPRILASSVAISFVLQINVITFYWVLAKALGLELDYTNFYIIVPIAIFVMMAPITINGIGLREAIFIFLLGLWSVEESLSLAFAWLEYATFLAFGLVGGAFYALRRE